MPFWKKCNYLVGTDLKLRCNSDPCAHIIYARCDGNPELQIETCNLTEMGKRAKTARYHKSCNMIQSPEGWFEIGRTYNHLDNLSFSQYGTTFWPLEDYSDGKYYCNASKAQRGIDSRSLSYWGEIIADKCHPCCVGSIDARINLKATLKDYIYDDDETSGDPWYYGSVDTL